MKWIHSDKFNVSLIKRNIMVTVMFGSLLSLTPIVLFDNWSLSKDHCMVMMMREVITFNKQMLFIVGIVKRSPL